jgi:lysophospholipase L1-like esterase
MKKGVDKMFMLGKRLSLSILLIMFLTIPGQAFAAPTSKNVNNYTSLGDSIAFGMSAANYNGFAQQMAVYLENTTHIKKFTYSNAAVPGLTSRELLTALKENSLLRARLKRTDFVTLSIGGNDLIQPLIAFVGSNYYPEVSMDPLETYSMHLAAAINADLPRWLLVVNDILLALQNPDSPLNAVLSGGVAEFQDNWDKIIAEIHRLAPNADIYVLNLYNPFPANNPLAYLVEGYIGMLNEEITDSGKRYYVVDVHTIFAAHGEGMPYYVEFFRGLPMSLDYHPTDAGHEAIFNSLKNMYEEQNKIRIPA